MESRQVSFTRRYRYRRILPAALLAALLTALFAAPAADAASAAYSDEEMANHLEVTSRLRDMVPYRLNLADPVEYAFFMKQLELAGVTAEDRPQLFRTIAEQRRRHQAGDFEPLTLDAQANPADEGLTDQDALNFISDLSTDLPTYSSNAVSSVRGGTLSTVMSLSLYDAQNNLLGTGQGGGTNPSTLQYEAQVSGTSQALGAYSLYTYYWTDLNGGLHGPETVRAASEDVDPTITNIAPVSASGSITDPIILCVNRTPNSGNMCTYGEMPRVNEILFPVQGNVVYPDAIDVNGQGKPTNGVAQLSLVDYTSGGGCSAWGPSSADFFDQATLSNGNKTLTWDFQPADFGPPSDCMHNGDFMNYTFTLLVYSGGNPQFASVTSTPPDHPGPNTVQISVFKLITGCLAEGTEVELADGSRLPVEAFEAEGEQVRDGAGRILEVVGNTRGVEPEPMVYLEDESGASLLLTAGHPVVTERGGAVVARDLEAGMRVITRRGASRLVRVEKRTYAGKVYNLELAVSGQQPRSEGETMYANGFLVGDANMQAHLNELARNRPVNVLDALPEEWHEDYLSSLPAAQREQAVREYRERRRKQAGEAAEDAAQDDDPPTFLGIRLAENGNVGIGTVDPQSTLHVAGDARVDGTLRGEGFEGLWPVAAVVGGQAASGIGAPFVFYYDDVNHPGSPQAIQIYNAATKVFKTFVIPHPLLRDHYLLHAAVEGPEGAVYYRGSARLERGRAVVELPSYFESLTRQEGRTVQLTAVGGFDPLAVELADGERVRDGRFTVISSNPLSTQEFDWEVKAVRQDAPPLRVEPRMDEVDVQGFGPYTYVRPTADGGVGEEQP